MPHRKQIEIYIGEDGLAYICDYTTPPPIGSVLYDVVTYCDGIPYSLRFGKGIGGPKLKSTEAQP